MIRRILLAIGIASTIAGSVLLLTPVTAPIEPPIVPTLGLVAAIGLVLAAAGARGRLGLRPAATALPEAGERAAVDVPGEGFDRELAAVSAPGDDERRERIRERLEAAAVAVLVADTECSADEAREQLRSGTWTEDREAAAFFAPETAPAPSLSERLRAFLAGELAFVRRAKRVVSVLAERQR